MSTLAPLALGAEGGEPRDIQIRFELLPAPDGGTLASVRSGFDVTSLGWLVKLVLRHHPEIQAGVHAGVALRAHALELASPR